MEVAVIVGMIIIFIIGFLLGRLIGKTKLPDTNGTLHVDLSRSDAPYIFLELNKDVNNLVNIDGYLFADIKQDAEFTQE